MNYVKTYTSVPRHRKFIQVGPAASWLWLCGNCYCQDGLTNGFIPDTALPFLGVTDPRPLVALLVAARLWDETNDGWLVHDYLDHNRSAKQVRTILKERRNAGKAGGVASGASRKQKAKSKHNDSLKQVASHASGHDVANSKQLDEANAKQMSNPDQIRSDQISTKEEIVPESEPEAPLSIHCPEDLRLLWNEVTTPPIPRCKNLDDATRRRSVVARLQDRGFEGMREVFTGINALPFLRGDNDRGWLASFDWALKPANITKVLEGNYARGSSTGQPARPASAGPAVPDAAETRRRYREEME